jgi:hypothetical protein
LFVRLQCALHELWLREYSWKSIEVFAPIYDLICAMMALHQLSFAQDGDDWHIVMSESECTVGGGSPESRQLISKRIADGGLRSTLRFDGRSKESPYPKEFLLVAADLL